MSDMSDEELEKLRASISWSPLVYSGSSFRTHTLHASPNGLRYWATIKSFLLPVIALILAGAVFFGIYMERNHGGQDPPSVYAYLIPIGLVALFIYRYYVLFNEVNEFNFKGRFYYRGLKTKRGLADENNYASFDDILAVQLMGEYVDTRGEFESIDTKKRGATFTSYEINLILKDGVRMNVVDYGSLNKVKLEAEIIARHLDIPLLVQDDIEKV